MWLVVNKVLRVILVRAQKGAVVVKLRSPLRDS